MFKPKIRFVSCDLNGTLVRNHTMADMILLNQGDEAHEQAVKWFSAQTSGLANIDDAITSTAPLTKGLTLRQAIRYTVDDMTYMPGFEEFLHYLRDNDIQLVVNTTGYSVTVHSIRARFGPYLIPGVIANELKFGAHGEKDQTLTEEELGQLVSKYFNDPVKAKHDAAYDIVKSTGEVHLNIRDERDKIRLLHCFFKQYGLKPQPTEIAHIGDSIGDSQAILEVARYGGRGIAFNYNPELSEFLQERTGQEYVRGNVWVVDPKGPNSDLMNIADCLK